MDPDLELAFRLADAADAQTLRWWNPTGVESTPKSDGSPVTDADLAAEEAIVAAVRHSDRGDAVLGEEVGHHPGTSGARWIIDGIDWTSSFAAGLPTWGTLIALERSNEIVLGLASSPAQGRRWWATRGEGAYTGAAADRYSPLPLHVSTDRADEPHRWVCHPAAGDLPADQQHSVEELAGGRPPPERPWSHQLRVAEGEIDTCIWFCGDIWDHAAPSIIVEEAGGRFSDHHGGRRLDTRTAIYSNGRHHDRVLDVFARTRTARTSPAPPD